MLARYFSVSVFLVFFNMSKILCLSLECWDCTIFLHETFETVETFTLFSHVIFLHGDIDVFGDIVNIATFASAFFQHFLDHSCFLSSCSHPKNFMYCLHIVYVFLNYSRSHQHPLSFAFRSHPEYHYSVLIQLIPRFTWSFSLPLPSLTLPPACIVLVLYLYPTCIVFCQLVFFSCTFPQKKIQAKKVCFYIILRCLLFGPFDIAYFYTQIGATVFRCSYRENNRAGVLHRDAT